MLHSDRLVLRDMRSRDFFQIDNVVIDDHLAKIGVFAYAVYSVMARHCYNAPTTFISAAKLSKLAGISLRTTQREIQVLVDAKMIVIESGKLSGGVNLYKLCELRFPQSGKVVDVAEKPEPISEEGVRQKQQIVVSNPVVEGGGYASAALPGTPEDASHNRKKKTINSKPEATTPPLFEAEVMISPDDLRKSVIDEIDRLWELANPGVDCAWVGLAFVRLKAELKKRPKWTADQWLTCVRNRFKSDNINAGEAPEFFIPKLPNYIKAPLNQFSKIEPEGGSHGKTPGDRTRNAVAQVLNELDEIAAKTQGHSGSAGGYRWGDGD